MKNKLASSAAE